jgi:hypothetical protein
MTMNAKSMSSKKMKQLESTQLCNVLYVIYEMEEEKEAYLKVFV